MTSPDSLSIPKRKRLPPAVRTEQILRAALVEFSGNGFSATRMDDIAHRAGLSKGGIYAHYQSKDQIFEALLSKMLKPPSSGAIFPLQEGLTREAAIDAFIDELYTNLADPDIAATFRLLVSEAGRVPHLVHSWYREIQHSYLDALQAAVAHWVQSGTLQASALTANMRMAFSPMVHAALWQMILGEEVAREEIEGLRLAHKQLLMELLRAGE